jgi:hypothetical protein
MIISKIKYLILSIILIVTSCAIPRDCIQCDRSSLPGVGPIIGFADEKPVLYTTQLDILKYHFSGLMAFRQMADSSGIRVVFLSQVGLRVMEFSYKGGVVTNTYCPEIIKKHSYVKFICSLIQTLLTEPGYRKICVKNSENKSDYFCRSKKGYREFEYLDNNKKLMMIRNGRNSKGEATYGYSAFLPDEIYLKLKYNAILRMKKIDNAFK